MVKNYSLGVVGLGFVGNAVYTSFSDLGANIKGYDVKGGPNTFEETIRDSEIIFLCLPAPTVESGNVDYSIYETVLKESKEIIDNSIIRSRGRIFCLKGTLPPGTCEALNKKYELNIINNVEFLTARTAIEDFKTQSQIVLGGCKPDVDFVAAMYSAYFPDSSITKCTSTTAEMIKYTCNVFYATKISFFNEIYKMCEHLNINYNEVMTGCLKNGWINPTHTLVPGTDGDFGYGGMCFPKDIKALAKFFSDKDIVCDTMKGAIKTNKKVRNGRN